MRHQRASLLRRKRIDLRVRLCLARDRNGSITSTATIGNGTIYKRVPDNAVRKAAETTYRGETRSWCLKTNQSPVTFLISDPYIRTTLMSIVFDAYN